MVDGQSRKHGLEEFYQSLSRPSDWMVVEQAMIDQFGAATLDRDWLHTDPIRARTDGPFGGTIAYGFWTLAMLTHLVRQAQGCDYPPGALYALNYGFERVRFLHPVPVGTRIRGTSRLLAIEPRNDQQFLVRTENTIEIENTIRPALVAEWLVLVVFAPEGQ